MSDRARNLARRALPLAVAILLLLVSTVRAEDILQLQGPVTDTTGSLAGAEDDIERAIDRTLDEDGVQVFVLFVETTGDRTAADYAFETAEANSLGVDDALLLVALEDRTDYIWLSDGLESITDDELNAVIADTLEPGLRDGDFPVATIATIEALGAAASTATPTEAPGATPEPAPPPDAGEAGGGGIGLGTIVGIALIGAAGVIIWRQWRKRRPGTAKGGEGQGTPAPEPIDVEALAKQATALLIATDERIRDAGQEVDFAEAQYGPDAVTGLRQAVAHAREELGAAFTTRQRLDDDIPEDEATRIALLQEIVDRTTRAQDRLDAETERIRELRDLERDAPTTLVELPARIEAVEDRLPAVQATFERVRSYAPTAWESVRGNLEEARKGLAGARNAVIAGSAAASDEDRSKVAVATREALEGLTGAGELLDAIERLAATIADAERRLPTELSSAAADLEAARAAAGVAPTPATDTQLTAAERALLDARGAADARPLDPIDALERATEAHRLADEALVTARDAQAEAKRLAAAADASVRTAAVEVDRAATFIASRRRGVGEIARTRLAEAQRHLQVASAIVATEPARASTEAKRAETLAREAYELARDDFSDWDQGGPGWGQRRGSGGDETAEILGQILGGVVGGVLAGGGRRGGGWGGSPWGGGGAPDIGDLLGGGGWGRGGGFGSGGFGGGGGGRGGGGRGAGGRW